MNASRGFMAMLAVVTAIDETRHMLRRWETWAIAAALLAVAMCAANAQSGGTSTATEYPNGAIPQETSATGTTGAVSTTIPAAQGMLSMLCGFSYSGSDATAAQAGSVTITGLVNQLNFGYPTLAAGVAVAQPNPLTVTFYPCLRASAVNTAITVTSPALGAGATVATVSAWGYQLPFP